ncbi:MAG: protein-S-isoprenylcysteine O-methyltransferase [Bacteroidota bacterium]
MNPLYLKIIYMVFYVAFGVIRRPHEKAQKKNKIVNDQKTTLEKVLLFATMLGMMLFPLLYIFSPWLNFANYQPPVWVPILGLLLMPFTLWLFYRSHKDLGQNWSVSLEVRDKHTLITDGVYKKVRHPMYTAIWLWVIIQALVLSNYIGGLSGIIGFGALYFLRVYKEEDMMIKEFGTAYQNYMQQTGRLIPKF